MKALLTILAILLLAPSAFSSTLYTYNGEFGAVGDPLTATAIGESTEGYWSLRTSAGGSAQKQTNATWGSDAGRLIASSWASTGNTKTAHSDVTITVRAGINSRFYMWGRWNGAYNGSNAHPTTGYTAQYFGGTIAITKNSAGGMATSLSSTAWTPANINDFEMKLVMTGSAISVYGDGVLKASATDATFTTGGVGFTTFIGTLWFDNLIVSEGSDDSPATYRLSPYVLPLTDRFPHVFPLDLLR